MSPPRLTKKMAKSAINSGADVQEKRKAQKPAPADQPVAADYKAEIQALRDEITTLKQALESERNSADNRSQELTGILSTLSEVRPMRLKPVRDMDRDSPTYLLVNHYDIVPVAYKKKDLN